ncbi:hypothetical protein, partial [Variovorax sp.]
PSVCGRTRVVARLDGRALASFATPCIASTGPKASRGFWETFGKDGIGVFAHRLRAKTTFAPMHQIPPNLDESIRSGRSMKSAETGET